MIGGGLGVRFGEPYAKRISAAMQPHLFNDERPPDVRVAALGDLGGATGRSAAGPTRSTVQLQWAAPSQHEQGPAVAVDETGRATAWQPMVWHAEL